LAGSGACVNDKGARPAMRQLFFGAGLVFSIPLGIGVNVIF
jgi:hypothetical protein